MTTNDLSQLKTEQLARECLTKLGWRYHAEEPGCESRGCLGEHWRNLGGEVDEPADLTDLATLYEVSDGWVESSKEHLKNAKEGRPQSPYYENQKWSDDGPDGNGNIRYACSLKRWTKGVAAIVLTKYPQLAVWVSSHSTA